MGRAGSVRYCCGSNRKQDTARGSRSQNRLKKGRIFIRFCFGSWGGSSRGARSNSGTEHKKDSFWVAQRFSAAVVCWRDRLQPLRDSWPLPIKVIPVTGFISSLLHLPEEKSASVRPNGGIIGGSLAPLSCRAQ